MLIVKYHEVATNVLPMAPAANKPIAPAYHLLECSKESLNSSIRPRMVGAGHAVLYAGLGYHLGE